MHCYFRGWYFKQQTKDSTIALIPAIHIDCNGHKTASIQVITNHLAHSVEYPMHTVRVNSIQKGVSLGDNHFSLQGIKLRIHTDTLHLSGELSFSQLMPPKYDIMGPFSLVPFMECRHSVFSLFHTVHGKLNLNGQDLIFQDAIGYIEGDRGHSFPAHYLWTQCSFENGDALMLSVAEIPFLRGRFIGIIGTVLLDEHEYRIATYLGAQVVSLQADSVIVRQGNLSFRVKLLKRQEQALRAPVQGSMARLIRESVACVAKYSLQKDGTCLLNRSSMHAGFEYEW